MSRVSRAELTDQIMAAVDPHLRADLEAGRGVQEVLKALAIVSASIMRLGGEQDIDCFGQWILRALKIHAAIDAQARKRERMH